LASSSSFSSPKTVSIESGNRAGLLRRRDELIESNLGLVRLIAESILARVPACFELDDLIGAGWLGLLKAATNYDPRRHNGTPFSAYARPVIRGAILDSIRREAWDFAEVTRTNLTEIPERGVNPDYEARLDREREYTRVRRAVESLGERERAVVETYYGAGERLPAVGERLGVSKSRASQLHVAALRGIRAELVGFNTSASLET
jgi:RNA polymerase sigma factor (sigma-70 family)